MDNENGISIKTPNQIYADHVKGKYKKLQKEKREKIKDKIKNVFKKHGKKIAKGALTLGLGYGLYKNRHKIKDAAGNLGSRLKSKFSEKNQPNSVDDYDDSELEAIDESAVNYIDNLLDTFYEAYYYDLLNDNEYEAFVESVYEADDIDEISDIETVFESYIE